MAEIDEVVVAEIDEATGMVLLLGILLVRRGGLSHVFETSVAADIGDSDAVVVALALFVEQMVVVALALLVEQMVVMVKHYLLGPIPPPICTV